MNRILTALLTVLVMTGSAYASYNPGSGGGTPGGTNGQIQYNASGAFGGLSIVPYTQGGTGLNTLGTAGQALIVNPGATGIVWGSAGSGSGTVNTGTFGQTAYYAGAGTAVSGTSAITLGTNTVTLGYAPTITPFTNAGLVGVGTSGLLNNLTLDNTLAISGSVLGSTTTFNALGVATTYTVLASDMGKVLTSTNTSSLAVTLPQAGTTGFLTGQGFTIVNYGTGTVVVTPTISTINGASSLTLQQGQSASFYSNGTNWIAALGGSNAINATASTLNVTGNGAASTSQLNISGIPYTGGSGTTTTPLIYISPSGTASVTNWDTTGTYLGLNAGSGFTGKLIGLHVNGGPNVFSVDQSGNVYLAGSLSFGGTASTLFGGNVSIPSASSYQFANRIAMASSGANALELEGQTTFNQLQFGGTSSSYPSLYMNGTTVEFRTASNSADTPITAAQASLWAVVSTGTKFTASGCSNGTTVGGATAGKFTLGANSCSVVVTMNGATGVTSPNGWSCTANDETAPTVRISETASSTATATLTIPAGAGTSDVIDFSCTGY